MHTVIKTQYKRRCAAGAGHKLKMGKFVICEPIYNPNSNFENQEAQKMHHILQLISYLRKTAHRECSPIFRPSQI